PRQSAPWCASDTMQTTMASSSRADQEARFAIAKWTTVAISANPALVVILQVRWGVTRPRVSVEGLFAISAARKEGGLVWITSRRSRPAIAGHGRHRLTE